MRKDISRGTAQPSPPVVAVAATELVTTAVVPVISPGNAQMVDSSREVVPAAVVTASSKLVHLYFIVLHVFIGWTCMHC